MKKLKFWLMAMLAIMATATLTACSDDDKDEPNVIDSPIVGTWVYESSTGSYSEQLTFQANGKYVYRSYNSEYKEDGFEEGIYTVSGNNATLKCTNLTGEYTLVSDQIGETTTLKWEISGNLLTIEVGDYTETFTRK